MVSRIRTIEIQSPGRGFYEISGELQEFVAKSGMETGICHVLLRHTSASLLITENADADVRRDLENFISGLAPDGDPSYFHSIEGPDDMPAHIRSVLTCSGRASQTSRPSASMAASLKVRSAAAFQTTLAFL